MGGEEIKINTRHPQTSSTRGLNGFHRITAEGRSVDHTNRPFVLLKNPSNEEIWGIRKKQTINQPLAGCSMLKWAYRCSQAGTELT